MTTAFTGHLIIGEGIETSISGAMRDTAESSALWALGSAGAIRKMPVIPDMTELTILVDADANGIGLDSARACAVRWRCAGRKVRLLMPRRPGADFNDLIRGVGR